MSYRDMWNDLRTLYEARNEPESIRPLADLYWHFMLSVAALLLVIALGWGVWVFTDAISALSSASPDTSNRPAALSRTQLEDVLAAYQARAQATSTVETTPITDPSR